MLERDDWHGTSKRTILSPQWEHSIVQLKKHVIYFNFLVEQYEYAIRI